MNRRLVTLVRSMPLRLALSLVALFAVVSLASLAASYAVSYRSLETAMREDLRQDMAGFRAAPSAAAVAALVEAEGRVTDPGRLLLSYFAPSGRHYGNAILARDARGYHLTRADGTDFRGEYQALTAQLYGGHLTIARSRAEIDDLGEVFRSIVLWSLLPTFLIALSGGLYLARRSAVQVGAMEATLERLTGGDLGARVRPGDGWSDDMAQIGRKIDRMAGALGQSLEAVRQVSSDVAHDLKTPLQRIAVQLDDLERADLPPEARATLERARGEVDGMVAVFHGLLQIAQVESGSPRSRFAQVDLSTLAETFGDLYEPTAAESGHALRLAVRPGVIVQGERDLLGQALANLIENALRHTPAGTGIEIAVERDPNGAARLCVSDTGPGIPEDERERVVQRLYRLDRSRGTPGSGLGLSLVAAVAEVHGAELSLADNAPGLRVCLGFAG